MKIDNTSSEHAYLQLAGFLRKRIESGEITARLPSLTELTAETHLVVGTVRRAIEILERERLVRRVPGRGTFVTAAAERQLPASPTRSAKQAGHLLEK